jgi:hypothetical protein
MAILDQIKRLREPAKRLFGPLWPFLVAIGTDWAALMSGSASVPFGFAAVLASSTAASVIWAIMAALLFGFAAFRVWSREHQKVLKWEERAKPSVQADWRVANGKAQLMLRNLSINTVDAINVMIRNWQRPDQNQPTDLMCYLTSIDGTKCPINLDPNVPYYFEFAKMDIAGDGSGIIVLLPDSDRSVQVGSEAAVKLSFSGRNVDYQPIDFRVWVTDDYHLAVESRDPGKPAVSPGRAFA